MKVVDISIDLIKEYENNPRNNDRAVNKVAESISKFGFKVPIVVDKDNVIVTGHTRVKAAKKLGLEKVPCIIANDLTSEQIKAFRLADNKVAEYSTWDEEKLYNELVELQTIDFDIESFGFEIKEPKIEEDKEEDEEDVIELDREEIGNAHNGLYLKIGNKKVQMTEDEFEKINLILEQYVNENGNGFGFVNYLIENLGDDI